MRNSYLYALMAAMNGGIDMRALEQSSGPRPPKLEQWRGNCKHTDSKLTRHEHYKRDKKAGRRIFGAYKQVDKRGNTVILTQTPNPVKTVLKVPELRKRRSERDPEVLREQQLNYVPR